MGHDFESCDPNEIETEDARAGMRLAAFVVLAVVVTIGAVAMAAFVWLVTHAAA